MSDRGSDFDLEEAGNVDEEAKETLHKVIIQDEIKIRSLPQRFDILTPFY